MGNLHKRNGVFYADYIDRHGKRQQPSLRTRDPIVAHKIDEAGGRCEYRGA